MKVDVSECIIDLLHNGSKVSLPGIGSLYVQNSSAEIKNNQIFPPHRNIVFTEEESDDLDLSYIIKRRYKVTQATATNVVNKFSQILINKLVNFNSVRIPNIGSFSNLDKGAFAFTEERNSINVGKEILPIYTLQKVSLSSSTEKASTLKSAAVATTAAAATATTTIIKTEKPVPTTGIKSTINTTTPATSGRTITTVQSNAKPVYTSPPEEEESFLRKYLWPILLLLLLGLLLTLGFKKCTSWLNSLSGTDDDIENNNSDSTDGAFTNGEDSDGSNLKEYDLRDIDNIPESVFADGCTIIVGSFAKSRNALNMLSRLKRMGYDTYKAVNDQGMTRVGIAIDCSPDNFESIIRKIRSEVEPTSWSLIPRIKVQY